jgi:hypothetical protein
VLVQVIAAVGEIDRLVVDRNPQRATRVREGLVNAVAAAHDDHDVGAVAGDDPADDRHRQFVTKTAPPEEAAPSADLHPILMALWLGPWLAEGPGSQIKLAFSNVRKQMEDFRIKISLPSFHLILMALWLGPGWPRGQVLKLNSLSAM